MGFYAAVWPLVDQPLADFQIGLPSSWIQPDNSDNKDQPLAPEGTLARTWKERGPTWSSVFQTVEGGLGYWAGNHFRYGPPKFSMNATPQCYDYEVGSPGWSFFYSNEALPDNRLGIAQLSNRLLIPPDALPFQGNPNGEFLGYTWMALPFTDPTTGDPPTGDQSWTCFLSAANFKGPIAYYIPETWSKIGKLFNYPFLYGRGLDARPGIMGGGAMEINTVPRFDAKDAQGTVYSKLPKLQFPVDAEGRAFLVQDVTYYSKAALYDAFKAWRDGGPACSGRFDEKGACKPKLNTRTTRYDQAGKKIVGVERAFDTRIFEGNVWGLQWFTNDLSREGPVPAILQTRRRRTRRGGRGGSAGGNQTAHAGVQAGQAGSALHLAHRRRLGQARPETRPVHGQARGWLGGDLLVVSLRGSAVVPAIQLERGEEGEAASLRGEAPRELADRIATTWRRPRAASWLRSIPPCSSRRPRAWRWATSPSSRARKKHPEGVAATKSWPPWRQQKDNGSRATGGKTASPGRETETRTTWKPTTRLHRTRRPRSAHRRSRLALAMGASAEFIEREAVLAILWREATCRRNKGSHNNRNAETYMEVGLRLGCAMADLMGKKP